jgi:hypothetical protein
MTMLGDVPPAGSQPRGKTATNDELILLEAEELDSFEAQARRAAGMARERAREAQLLQMYGEPSCHGARHASDDDVDALALLEGLHRRAAGVPAAAPRRGRGGAAEEEDGQAPISRRRRKRPNPYANIPFFVAETMCGHLFCCAFRFLARALRNHPIQRDAMTWSCVLSGRSLA